MKTRILNIMNLLVCLGIFLVMSLPLHEAGHSLASWMLGVPGTIELNWAEFGGVFLPDAHFTGFQYYLVAFAGGGFVALVYALLLVFAHVGKKWDEDDLTGLRLVLAMQLGYGIGEPISQTASGIGLVVGVVAALAYSMPKLIKWYGSVNDG